MPLFTLIVLTLTSFIFLLSTSLTKAQEGLTLQVSPPILEIEIKPGETYSDFIKFENLSATETLTLYPQILSFKAKGDEGAQEFIEDTAETTNFSLAQWVVISTDMVVIKPLERIVLPFTITVPVDAEPGGRYAAVFLGNQPIVPEEGSNVALGAKTGSIILAKISGDVTESATLTTFKTGKESYQYPPVDFEVVIKNNGNIHVKPEGNIQITNMFGKEVTKVDINKSGGNVLPESSRKYTPSWETDKFTLGKFTAVLNLTYGEQNPMNLSQTISFWVLPVKEIVIALAALSLLILLFFVLVKTYNRMIMKKALKMREEVEKTNPITNTQTSATPTPQNTPVNPPSQMS